MEEGHRSPLKPGSFLFGGNSVYQLQQDSDWMTQTAIFLEGINKAIKEKIRKLREKMRY